MGNKMKTAPKTVNGVCYSPSISRQEAAFSCCAAHAAFSHDHDDKGIVAGAGCCMAYLPWVPKTHFPAEDV